MTPDALARLHARAAQDTRAWTQGDFAQTMASPGALLCASEACFALGRVIVDEAELLLIATDPQFQRQGRGAAMLAQFEIKARSLGAVLAHLEVAAPNAAARALYEAAGWRQVGQRLHYYSLQDGTKADAILMSKPLQSEDFAAPAP